MKEKDFEQHEAIEDGYSKWVYPKKNYLFKCCDCGLVHEMEFGVFTQGEKDDLGNFDVMPVEDTRIRPMFRARRIDPPVVISPEEIDKRWDSIWRSEHRVGKRHFVGFLRLLLRKKNNRNKKPIKPNR